MGDRAQAADIRLEFHEDDNLPHVKADQRLFRQILINLVSNAVKFSPPGKSVNVGCVFQPNKNGLLITVEDKGCGIPDDKLDIVQEPFGQVNDPRYSSSQGTGLGLPLAKAMVEMHGGFLEIKSEVAKGTLIIIGIPKERLIPIKKK